MTTSLRDKCELFNRELGFYMENVRESPLKGSQKASAKHLGKPPTCTCMTYTLILTRNLTK